MKLSTVLASFALFSASLNASSIDESSLGRTSFKSLGSICFSNACSNIMPSPMNLLLDLGTTLRNASSYRSDYTAAMTLQSFLMNV